jgi:hypothetical protein
MIETDDVSTNAKEVDVLVSSYQLGPLVTLRGILGNATARHKLNKRIRRVKVAIVWLESHCRPKIAAWLKESLFGATMHRIPGYDGVASALALSFSGRPKRDATMVPLPKRHKPALFGHDNYDMFDNVTDSLCLAMKKEAVAYGGTYLAPPPKNDTQIIKLKWAPSCKAKHSNARDRYGSWRGAFAVDTGASKAVVLQECGLPRAWVEENFALLLRRECQDIALQLKSNRNPKKYVLIPAGDVHNAVADPPPASELLAMPVRFQQGDKDTCLRDSLASALHAFGFSRQAVELSSNTQLAGCNLSLVGDVSAVVRKLFAKENLQLVKLFSHACSVAQIHDEEMSWPMVLVLMTNDGCYGTHAVTLWQGQIFDANLSYALRWSQQSLDWCSGKGSACVGFSRAFRLCPVHFGKQNAGPNGASRYPIGKQVYQSDVVSDCIGWIMRLPSLKKDTYHVHFTNGATTTMSDDEVSTLCSSENKT